MRFSITNLLVITTIIAMLAGLSLRWRGLAMLFTALLLPWLVLRFQSWDTTRRKFPLFIVFLISFGPLYVASLGPYYFLVVNVLLKGTAKGSPITVFGSYFYAPVFDMLRTHPKSFLEPFFEYYLFEWIGYGAYFHS